MPSFRLQPVTDADFRAGDPHHHRITIDVPRPAGDLWAELHGERPLHWCAGISEVRWTSGSPHGVGATREVRLSTVVRVAERYFRWEEGDDEMVNAFTVEAANVPLFRRFGERYRVTADGSRSVFDWEFVIEPRLPAVLQAAARRLVARDLDRLGRDTAAHFGGVTVR